MISRPLTRVTNSTEMALSAQSAPLAAEGQALVFEGGVTDGVLVSNGAPIATGSQSFAGFVFVGTSAYPFPEMDVARCEVLTVGTDGSVTLGEAADGTSASVNSIAVFNNETGAKITGATWAPTSPTLITGLTAGMVVRVVYSAALNAVRAAALYGHTQPGGYAGNYVGQVGMITRGFVATSEFDTSLDWSTANTSATTAIVAGANGKLKLGASDGSAGAVVKGRVTRLPDDMYPFLGITFNSENA